MSRSYRQRVAMERHIAARQAEATHVRSARPRRARRLTLTVIATGAAAFASAAWRAAIGGTP